MPLSIWPTSKDRSARLRQFHASPYFPGGKDEERKHPVSPFWRELASRILTFVDDRCIAIDSASSYHGPAQIEEQEERQRSQHKRLSVRAACAVGRIGRYVPNVIWNAPDKLARRWLQISTSYVNATRAYHLSKDAFLEAFKSKPDAVIQLENIHRVPILYEQLSMSAPQVLYIASMVNTLSPYIV